MDANQWTQDQIVGSLKGVGDDDQMASSKAMVQERKVRPQKEQALNCPRCQSTNTKFCYYNNYSLTQPRYFCKTCRRYWTEGGTLRNVPVGGGSRKNKRSSSSTANITSSHNMKLPHHVDLNPTDPNIISHFAASQNPKIHVDVGQDLNLAYPPRPQDHYHHILNGAASQFFELPKSSIISSSSSPSTSTTPFAALELLASRSRMPELNALCSSSSSASTSSSGLSLLQDLKPAGGMISLSVDPHHHGVGSRFNINPSGIQENNGYGGRLMFPFGVMKQIQSTNEVVDQNKGQSNPNGYWNGMFGGGGSSW